MLGDLRIAVRALRSWRWGTLAAVLTLAVGIGTTTSLYTLLRTGLDASATRIEHVDRLGRVYASDPATPTERTPIRASEFDVLSAARSFELIAAWTRTQMVVGRGVTDDTVSVTCVSAQYFSVLRARALAGRLFVAADFDGMAPVALVNDRLWWRRFAGRSLDDDVTITLNGTPRRVVGVVPGEFEFSFIGIGGDAWIPMTAAEKRANDPVSVIARLKPEHTWTAAAAELEALTPATGHSATSRWHIIPVEQDSRFRTTSATGVTLLPALVVLVIACVNVVCMLLARGLERDIELSVRAALGASRGRIVRQLLIENLVLATLGGLAGAAVAAGLLRLIARSIVAAGKPWLAARLAADFALLPVALGATAVACLLFGVLPAVRLSRRDISASLKGVAPPSRVRIAGYGARDLVVFGELGLAVVLVVLAAMYLSLISAIRQVTVPFAADQLIALSVPSRDLAAVRDRVSALAGVEGISVASALPAGPRMAAARLRSTSDRVVAADLITVDDVFFATIGLPIARGRPLDRAEAVGNAPVAIVSESAARILWPDADPVGQSLDLSSRADRVRVTVVGVSRDIISTVRGVQPSAYPFSGWASAATVFRPLAPPASREPVLLVRARDARTLRPAVAAAAQAASKGARPDAVVLSEHIRHVPADATEIIRLVAGLGLLALLLAASGIYGIVNQSVLQRTREFGVRMALGATPGRVLRVVLMREGKLIAAALFAGSIGTMAVIRTLAAEFVWISALNPAWPASLIGLCGVIAALACAFATYRIVTLDPSAVLRRS
jgi:predicted permease